MKTKSSSLIQVAARYRVRKKWLTARWLVILGVAWGWSCAVLNQKTVAPTSPLPHQVMQIINEVQKAYCPDPRLGIFKVEGRIEKKRLILDGESTSKAALAKFNEALKSFTEYEIQNNLQCLPLAILGPDTSAIVRISVGNLYRKPDVTSEILNQAWLGSRVRILKASEEMYLVQLMDQYLGWMEPSVLAVGDINLIHQWEAQEKAIVTAWWGQVKTEMDERAPVVIDLVAGAELGLMGTHQNWSRVILPDGRTGFVQNEVVQSKKAWLQRSKATAQDLLNTAMQLQGIPYLWGGTSTKGLDCSGFIYTVFRMNRIVLPRDANMQVNVGKDVALGSKLENLQPADLLFFGPGSDRITHVGLYIGNFQFIHADGYVHQNSFRADDPNYNPYRLRSLRRAKRILNHE